MFTDYLCFFVLTSLIFFPGLSIGFQAVRTVDYEWTQKALEEVIQAIDRAQNYFGANWEKVNLDGWIGVRIVEDRISALLARYWTTMPYDLVTAMLQISETANRLAAKGQESTKMTTPYYYSRVGFMIRPYSWSLYYPPRQTDSQIQWSDYLDKDTWEEQDCDDCMHELITKRFNGTCAISPTCWTNASESILSGYSLAHQVIYLLLGVQNGCGQQLNEMATRMDPPTTLSELMRTKCSRLEVELQDLFSLKENDGDRDLGMEMIGICGTAGFLNLANPKWLPQILSWQAPSGCYHKFLNERINPLNFDPSKYGHSRRRRKRSEQLLSLPSEPEQCLAHRTSVALAALAAYMTKFVEALYGSEQCGA